MVIQSLLQKREEAYLVLTLGGGLSGPDPGDLGSDLVDPGDPGPDPGSVLAVL